VLFEKHPQTLLGHGLAAKPLQVDAPLAPTSAHSAATSFFATS
jgi:hypothetical protein